MWRTNTTYHCVQHFLVIVLVTDSISSVVRCAQVQKFEVVHSSVAEEKVFSFLRRRATKELIEHVVISFASSWVDQSDFFEQVRLDLCSGQLTGSSKSNVNVFSEARRVVVSDGSCVSKRFQDRIALQHLLFDTHTVRSALVRGCDTKSRSPP